MLSLTIPYVNSWNAWFTQIENRPEGVPPLRDKVDAACRAAGRDPAEVERTVAVLVRLSSAVGPRRGGEVTTTPPVEGPPEVIADTLRAFAREGIRHIQLVVDPITEASLEALKPVLDNLDGKG
jgi:alkanesulfonate monooxygenase SsuD/methylene tetrahydromethanopterin reductase-like flavin-dependent oxidoreductase (luciferase family)